MQLGRRAWAGGQYSMAPTLPPVPSGKSGRRATAGGDQVGHWVPLAGRQGGTVPAVVLSPIFMVDRLAFAATYAGIFRSRDGGSSWEPSNEGLGSYMIQSIAFSPRYPVDHTLYALSLIHISEPTRLGMISYA